MRSKGEQHPGLPSLGLADYVSLCLGFGCFFAVCPFSALGTAAMLGDAMSWQEILVSRVVFLACSAAFFALRNAKGPGWCLPRSLRGAGTRTAVAESLLGTAGAAAGFVLLTFGYPLLTGGALAVFSGCLLGFAMATLGGGWFRVFFATRRERGRTACVVAFACSFLATVLLTWLANLLGVGQKGRLVEVTVLLTASWGLFFALTGRSGGALRDTAAPCKEFEPSPYARTLLLGLGVSWACSYNLTIELGYGTGTDQFARWAMTLVSCGALLVLAVVFVRKVDIGETPFGLMMRWVVIIPFLPSRGSSANVFTMARLPEDEDAEARNERARRSVAEEYGFTVRETEVFELLMRGMTREEVAAELEISPWTVKNHIRAVFAKTGAHSTKELMALVYDGEA